MLGTLAKVLAGAEIETPPEKFWCDVEGDIENVNGTLKITAIRVTYHLEIPRGKADDARAALKKYIEFCPGAQSVIGCIDIQDELVLKETG